MEQTLKIHHDAMDGARRRFASRSSLQVQVRSLSEMDSRLIDAWQDLEASASIRNPFVSPAYVIPAARHLPGVAEPVIITIEQQGQMLGLGVFENRARSRRLPVRHLRSWQTPHTYFDGLLLRDGDSGRALQEFWAFLARGHHDWHGVDFPRMPVDEPATRLLDASAQQIDGFCLEGTPWSRACLLPQESDAGTILQTISVKRAKSLRRGWRELEKSGTVHFEFQQDPGQMAACAEELMHLENLGWKCDIGTSLAANSAHTRFFRELIFRMNEQGNVSFTRLRIDDRAVASVVNFRAGDTLYAFKLGWDPEFERGCPGFHLKMQTAAHAGAHFPDVRMIDSCSQPGSFIEHVWPQRRAFCSRTYVTSPVGSLAASMVQGLRWVRNSAVAVSKNLFRGDQNRDPG
ncbi:GNAT family N-acetyltransferase [Planctomicrobium piriforme]|uniref:Acetyltransferase involved in cellulose biosynthesis, CelD/BcsL family n=1 Tax=Planctomicrobium piriforme TaxID=1576369 RepID=A0A1I3SVG6_9PLAN|nr:GNAT family N-acetyltransferase [Planctomicrobium piriforme]SFJ62785.1 Acetyltransferase involved in cellulose biosynthesis, CelD/BcsL family [Planctomicrobium piriforme]